MVVTREHVMHGTVLGPLAALAVASLALCMAATGPAALRPADAQVVAGTAVLALAILLGPAGPAALHPRLLVLWCAGAALVAAVDATLLARAPIGAGPAVRVALVTLLQVFAAHALLARTARSGTEPARTLALAVLAALGLAPVWLGPLVLLTPGAPWLADLVLAACPPVHLSVAAGGDLLRSSWFYEHSGLGSIRFAYPLPGPLALAYAAAAATLSVALFRHRQESNP